jgi:hypothetical protein
MEQEAMSGRDRLERVLEFLNKQRVTSWTQAEWFYWWEAGEIVATLLREW